ncbi:MAG: rhodanese-like domain-containing protein [Cellvibrio sp.]|nr:rhodanese-like domain-containing protein [Cellvibrio sp.]
MNFFVFIAQEWILVSVLIVLVYLYYWRERTKSGLPLSAHEVTLLLNKDAAIVVDLRESGDFRAGHIVNSLNIPYSRIITDTSELSSHKDKIIVLVDKLGQHAGAAGRKLDKEGYQVRRLSGGISEWQAQNLPLVKGKKT